MELKILFKNTSYLVVTKVVKFAVGIIRAKLIAIFLGTFGAGIIAQLLNLTQSLSNITLLSMNDGLVKQIAESNKSNKEIDKVIATIIKSYVLMISFVLLFVIALSIYFSKELTIYFFGDSKYYFYFIIGLVSFPILILNSISFAILKSYKQIKYIARSELIVIIINILFFIPLLYFWGLTGAVIYVTISLLTVLIVNHYYAQNKILNKLDISVKTIYKSGIDKKAIKEIIVFAGFGLIVGAALIFTDTMTRSIVVTQLGISEMGIYSPVLTWAGLFTGFILPSIGTYLYPRFSEAKSDSEIIGILNDSIRYVTLIMIPFLLLSIPIRFQIIPLFYSKEFKLAGKYLPWHFLGTLFSLWMFSFTQAMTPTGRIKIHGILLIIICFVDLATVYFLVPVIGLYGWMLKFIISPTIFFFVYFLYFTKAMKFRFEKKNIVLMIYIIISFVTLMVFGKFISPDFKINLLIGLSLTGLSFLILEKSERNFILSKIKLRK